MASGWRLVTRKTNHMIKECELWASSTSREGKRAGDVQSHGQWGLIDHINIMKTNETVSKNSGHQDMVELPAW